MGTQILPALFTMATRHALSIATTARPLSQVTDAWTQPVPSGVRVVLTPDHPPPHSDRVDGEA